MREKSSLSDFGMNGRGVNEKGICSRGETPKCTWELRVSKNEVLSQSGSYWYIH